MDDDMKEFLMGLWLEHGNRPFPYVRGGTMDVLFIHQYIKQIEIHTLRLFSVAITRKGLQVLKNG